MATGVTTEWEDIQVRMGNWKPREQQPTSEDYFQANVEAAEEYNPLQNKKLTTLEEMKEDDPDLEDDDEFMKQYREKRLQELKVDATKPKYGSIIEINRPQFEVEVNRAPQDVIVIIHLYQDHIPECRKLNEILAQLAKKHPTRKFIKIVANKCIENYLDIDCPGILIYKNGDLMDKIIPAGDVFGGVRMNMDTVEFVLGFKKVIDVEFEEDPREKLKLFNAKISHKKHKNQDESDSEEEDDREYTSNQLYQYQHHMK